MALGENLRLLRTGKKMTQKAFAREFGISESVVSLYESNKRSPNYDLLIEFADFYGVSLDFLLDHSRYVVAPLSIGGDDSLRKGMATATSVQETRKAIAEAVMNQTVMSDKKIWDLREFVLELK